MGFRNKTNANAAVSSGYRTTQISEDQSYELQKSGSYVEVHYFFHGEVWEAFFREYLRVFDQHHATFFIGAKIDPLAKIVKMHGTRSFTYFTEKYAPIMKNWQFVATGKSKVHLPLVKDEDALKFSVNGIPIEEISIEAKEMQQKQAQNDQQI